MPVITSIHMAKAVPWKHATCGIRPSIFYRELLIEVLWIVEVSPWSALGRGPTCRHRYGHPGARVNLRRVIWNSSA